MENLNERKLKIIQNIIELDDINILSKIEELLLNFQVQENETSVKETPSVYQSKLHLTENQKKMLHDAEEEIEKGNFYMHEEVKKMTEEWLK